MIDRLIDAELLSRKIFSARTIESSKRYNLSESNKIYNAIDQKKGYYNIIEQPSLKSY